MGQSSRNQTSILTQSVENATIENFNNQFKKLEDAALQLGKKKPKKGEFLERIIKSSSLMNPDYDVKKYFV